MSDDLMRETLSERVAGTLLGAGEAWTRRMFELAVKMRSDGGGPVWDLSLGNPSLEPPELWREAVRELLVREPPGQHRYMSNAGFPEVRAFIAAREQARYDLPFEGDDVTMTVGAAGAINNLFRCVLDPGDEVVVPAPYFSEYGHYTANVGAKLVPVATTAGFALDVEAIGRAIGDRTRVLLLNSPNNPTGAVYDDASLGALADVLDRARPAGGARPPILVIEDTPYRDVVHDGAAVPSMLSHHDDTVLVTSHSKDLGLAGERIGYLVISPRARGRLALRRATSFCNRVLGFVNAPALMQRVLPKVLGQPGGTVDVGVYAANCRKMAEGLVALGFELEMPKAGFFLFPGLPEAMRVDESSDGSDEGGDIALTERLRAERCIVVPGMAFGVPGHLRLSMCVEPPVVDAALAAFRRVCG